MKNSLALEVLEAVETAILSRIFGGAASKRFEHKCGTSVYDVSKMLANVKSAINVPLILHSSASEWWITASDECGDRKIRLARLFMEICCRIREALQNPDQSSQIDCLNFSDVLSGHGIQAVSQHLLERLDIDVVCSNAPGFVVFRNKKNEAAAAEDKRFTIKTIVRVTFTQPEKAVVSTFDFEGDEAQAKAKEFVKNWPRWNCTAIRFNQGT